MGVELFGVLALVGYFVLNGIVVVKLNHESRVKKSRSASSRSAASRRGGRGSGRVKHADVDAE